MSCSISAEQREVEVEDAKQGLATFLEAGGTFNKGRELVHFHDTPEQVKRSCVHAITVNHDLKRVDVIFRGTENNAWKTRWYDWTTNTNLGWRNMPNPVKELQGDIPTISFHNGFASTLLGNKYKKSKEMKSIKGILDEIGRYVDTGYR